MCNTDAMTTDQFIGERVHMIQWRDSVPSSVLTARMGISPATLSRKLHGMVHLVVMDALGVSAATPLCPACAAGVLLAAGQTVAGVTAGHSDADLAPCDVRGE